MRLMLARHGNTFAPGAPAVWIGGGEGDDLPLVPRGRAQARAIARLLELQRVRPVRILTGPLLRTVETAQIIARHLDAVRALDEDGRLREIDYGDWSRHTTDQLIDRYGPEVVEDWQHFSRWPEDAGWEPGEAKVRQNVQDLVWDLASEGHDDDHVVLAVTSNGILRYFLTLIEGEFERRMEMGGHKVATGHLCQLSLDDGQFTVDYWNQAPADLDPAVAALDAADADDDIAFEPGGAGSGTAEPGAAGSAGRSDTDQDDAADQWLQQRARRGTP